MTGEDTGRDPYEQWDAAYAFGALEPDETRRFEQHLTGCAACRARVDEARSTVAMLGAPSAVPDVEVPPIPDTLLPGLLRAARRERRRRRSGVAALAGVAAACLVALVVAVWPGSSAPSPGARAQAMSALRPSNVTATAALEARKWGTEIDVHCKYVSSDGSGRWSYGLRVIDRAGHAHPAGTWQINDGQAIDFVGGTEVRRDRIARVQVTLPDGTPILQLTP